MYLPSYRRLIGLSLYTRKKFILGICSRSVQKTPVFSARTQCFLPPPGRKHRCFLLATGQKTPVRIFFPSGRKHHGDFFTPIPAVALGGFRVHPGPSFSFFRSLGSPPRSHSFTKKKLTEWPKSRLWGSKIDLPT